MMRDQMKKGDQVLYYHSNVGLEIVGIAKVIKEHYQDPTTSDDRWVVVDIEPVRPLKSPVPLRDIKSTPALKNIPLLKNSRLSVMPVTKKEFDLILKMGA